MEDLYKQSQAESGLYIGRRLTYEHLHLTSYSKMKVNLAAQVKLYKLHAHLKFTLHNCNDNYQQVLSNSVACAFKLLKKEEYKETSRFCSMFNRFFDCFNTRRAGEGKEKRNPDLDPYTNVDDIRLTVCKLKA